MIPEFSSAFQSVPFVYQSILCILSFGLIINSLEDLKTWSIYKTTGLLSWKVGKLGALWNFKSFAVRTINFILEDKCFQIALVLKLICSVFLFIISIFSMFSPILIVILFFLVILLNLRTPYGLDGAYQMYVVKLLALSIGTISGIDSETSKICLWFIGGELVVSYFIAGLNKLMSPIWRKTHALHVIFSTKSYGNPLIYKILNKNDFFTTSLSWFIFLFEMFVVCALFLPPPFAVAFCVLGLLFHLFNACFMGLNDFLFAFPATYPAFLYCVNVINS